MRLHHLTHAALFDLDGASPNPSADPRPLLQAAEVIVGHDTDTGDEFVLFGRDVEITAETMGVVIEMDVLQKWELANVIKVVETLRGCCDFDPNDFCKHERIAQ